MKTQIWHTYLSGYRARIANIPRNRNWYATVRPDTEDSLEWFNGWDMADKGIVK